MCAKQYYHQNQQYNNQQQMQQPQMPPTPTPPKPKYKFRWAIFIGIPLTIAAFCYVKNQLIISYTFEELLEYMNVIHRTKYARLACLAVFCIVFIIIVKSLQGKRE